MKQFKLYFERQNADHSPMPRLNSTSSMRKIASKRVGIPHSPFQKLIDGARVAKGYSLRELSDIIGTSHSSLHIWLTNANGYPHPKAFKQTHLAALSESLSIPLPQIQVALDESRQLYTAHGNPMPPTVVDSFRHLIEILENDTRKYLLRTTVLNLARRLYSGSSSKQ